MRAASILVVAIASCGGPSAPPPNAPVTADPPVTADQPLVVEPPAVDGGAAPSLDDDEPVVVAVPVSWPTDRGPAQLHFLGGGTASSAATAVSADGSTPVGVASAKSGFARAVRWRSGTLTPLETPASVADRHASAFATSRNGDVVVGLAITTNGKASTALVWQKDGSGAALTTPDGATGARALAVSRDGSIIVGCAGDCASIVKWTRDTWTTVPTPERFEIGAHGLSEDGATLAGTIDPTGASPEGARIGTSVERRGSESRVSGISDDGTVVVGSVGGRAALWRGKTLTDLGVVSGFNECHAVAVSSDGKRVVGSCRRDYDDTVPGGDHRFTVAFIWDKKHGIRPVHEALAKEHKVALPDGTWLDEARDICGYGLTVVGTAVTATSSEEAFLAIVPR